MGPLEFVLWCVAALVAGCVITAAVHIDDDEDGPW
jgi:hypothetical protein